MGGGGGGGKRGNVGRRVRRIILSSELPGQALFSFVFSLNFILNSLSIFYLISFQSSISMQQAGERAGKYVYYDYSDRVMGMYFCTYYLTRGIDIPGSGYV